MSGKKVLSATLATGDVLTIRYSSKLATILIKNLTSPMEEEEIVEYTDATIEFISGDHAGKADFYDIIQNKNNKTIQFIHKNRGNFSLPASMDAVDTVTPSNSASAAANSSDSEYDSSGGARRRRRSTKSKKSKRSKRSTKSKKSKKGKTAKKSRYTRRH